FLSMTVAASSRFRTASLVAMLALVGVANAFGAKPICSDLPVSVSFVPTIAAPAAILNDLSNTPYQAGVDHVGAVIHYQSSCDGTRDMTLNLLSNSTPRALSMQFPNPIAGSIILGGPPSFAGGPAFLAKAFLNVRNILAYPMSPTPATFYTKVIVQ